MKRMIAWCAFAGLGCMPALGSCMAVPDRIILMWQVTGKDFAADFSQLAQLGVNAVQSFRLREKPQEYVDAYLASAAANGIGVIPFVGSGGDEDGVRCGLPDSGLEFVRRYAQNPAIMAWHSVDEPADHKVSKECQRKAYSQIKAIDPAHPVMLTVNFTKQSQYTEYFTEDAFDILDLHKYVNPWIGPAQERLVDLYRKNRKRQYPVILTLRAYDAPGKIKRFNMGSGSLLEQYAFFVEKSGLSQNVGFYGWELSPNLGLKQIDWMRGEFEQLVREKRIHRETR